LKASRKSETSWWRSFIGANVSLVTYCDSKRTECWDELLVCRKPAVFLIFERLVVTFSA
jgi:hypothetical protein